MNYPVHQKFAEKFGKTPKICRKPFAQRLPGVSSQRMAAWLLTRATCHPLVETLGTTAPSGVLGDHQLAPSALAGGPPCLR